MYQFKLYFDGGCKPNPGQGYGSYEIECGRLTCGNTFKHRQELLQFGFMTNNMAEYQSMISALKKLFHESGHGWLYENGYCRRNITLDIYSDSKMLVEQMNGRWKTKVAHIQELRDEARLILKEFGHWKITWQPRKHNVARFGH